MCTGKGDGWDLVDIDNAQEVVEVYDWLSSQGIDMDQGNGVAIAFSYADNNTYIFMRFLFVIFYTSI